MVGLGLHLAILDDVALLFNKQSPFLEYQLVLINLPLEVEVLAFAADPLRAVDENPHHIYCQI